MAHFSRIHALLIGIDEYDNNEDIDLGNLAGAVADATSVRDYLLNDLHVPDKQIVVLHNEEATRNAIIQQLRTLRSRKSLCEGDPVLVYFAGHGTIAAQKTPMILPYYDAVATTSDDAAFEDGISTAALMDELIEDSDAKSRGDNITIILDCCNSALRNEHVIVSTSNLSRPSDAGYIAAKSHVLLSACREGEHAYEENGRGGFTDALLVTLRELGPRISSVTYQDLMEYVPDLPNQTPRCEGRNADRFLFQTHGPTTKRTAYRISVKDEQYIISAGFLHGIVAGAQFSIYTSRHSARAFDEPLTIMQATTVDDFSAVLSRASGDGALAITPSSRYFALQASPGATPRALRLHVSGEIGAVREVIAQGAVDANPVIVCCESDTLADLGVRESADGLEFLICDPKVTEHGLHRLCKTTPMDAHAIRRILRGANIFLAHLQHSPAVSSLRQYVSAEVLKLGHGAAVGSSGMAALTSTDHDAHQPTVVHVVADDATDYGILIRSRLTMALHVWVFYFDYSDLSIVELYRPPAWGLHGEATLPAVGSLFVDHGTNGGKAFSSYLRANQDVDVGFFKVFMSTVPIDLSHVEQRSPFETKCPRGIHLKKVTPPGAFWDAITIPVVQRRPDPTHVLAESA